MIAVDTNVLVAAHRREMAEHRAAAELMRTLVEGSEPWTIPWPCIYEFFSVATNARIWKDAASTPDQAWAQIAQWLHAPTLRLLSEPVGFEGVLERFARRGRVRGARIHDARIAALCVAHGVDKLLTRDRDFVLFPELEAEDPFTP